VPSITLPDSRKLAYERMGGPDGVPVIVLHGTPGSSRQLAALGPPADARGIAVVAPDRGGYGGSSHDPSRTIASSAHDVGMLIAQLGLPACGVVGISLICARLAGRPPSPIPDHGRRGGS
jgi:pimeloyl-ACP methyl ester carboxylesterase